MALSQAWTVVCDADKRAGRDEDVCCASERAKGNRKAAVRELGALGWRFARNYGWYCPACVAAGKFPKVKPRSRAARCPAWPPVFVHRARRDESGLPGMLTGCGKQNAKFAIFPLQSGFTMQ